MSIQVRTYAPGTFCWTDLATSNPSGARRFYAGLMGWDVEEVPMQSGESYFMLKKDGRDVAAFFSQSPQQRETGVPPQWMNYVAVRSVDESARKAEELGGRILVAPFDVLDVGRQAVIQDPTGGVLSLWEARRHHGAGMVREPGSMCWNELLTPDVDLAARFYQGLFGWTTRVENMGEMGDYTIFMNNEEHAGGMMAWTSSPPAWLVYFEVASCDAIANRVPELGGKVLSPPRDIPTAGRFAILQDPAGGVFAVLAHPKK